MTLIYKNSTTPKEVDMLYMAFIILMGGVFFAYSELWGVRILPVLVGIALLWIFSINKRIPWGREVAVTTLLSIMLLLMGWYSHDFSGVRAAAIFFVLCYWPWLVRSDLLVKISPLLLYKIYLSFVAIIALGVVCQYVAFYGFDNKLWRVTLIDIRVGRWGFGFLGFDYSFLSLLLTASIPLAFIFKGIWRYVGSLLFLTASFLTSARTGVFSLVTFTGFYILWNAPKLIDILKTWRASRWFAFGLLTVLVIVGGGFIVQTYFERFLSLNSSGRIEGYLKGLIFFSEHWLWGAYYSIDGYMHDVASTKSDTVPHNLFLFNLAVGGGIFFTVFLVWLALTWARLRKVSNAYWKYAVGICFIGMQFIPSFFSTYFFALLLSLGYVDVLQQRERRDVKTC